MNEMIFCFNQQEAQLILDALVELPFKRVADFIFKIQRQAAEQITESTAKKNRHHLKYITPTKTRS